MRLCLFAFTVSLSLASATAARAADPAAAQALFDEGKRLFAAGDVARACSAFEESQRLDPGTGTLFHIAECDERLGRLAGAWAAYLQVASEAKSRGDEARERVAREKAAALEPRLARLAIDGAADRDAPGLEITRDGVAIGPGAWGTAVPVDAGDHVIEARAAGYAPWRATVHVADGARESVAVPPLTPAPAPAPASESASATSTTSADVPRATGRGSTQRAIGLTLGATGLVAAGVGTYFGLVSKSKHDDAAPHCAGDACDPTGVALRQDAIRSGNAATVSFVAGGALLVGGLVTFFTAPHDAAAAWSQTSAGADAAHAARPRVAVSPAGVFVTGGW